MLAIRLQRKGRKGLASYRVIVQEHQRSPKSERIVARLGHYNPHAKEVVLDKDKAKFYLDNGAQPSDRMIKILKKEKMKLPGWVAQPLKQKTKTKNPQKLRKNQPKDDSAKKDEPKAKDEQAESSPDESKEDKSPAEETRGNKPSPAEATEEQPQPSEAPAQTEPPESDE